MGTPLAAPCPPPPPAGVRAFGRGDQLQQFLRIIQPLLEFRPERLGRDLSGDADIPGQRIGRHKLHFINLDRAAQLAAGTERFFDLLGNVLCFRSGNCESAYQAGEVLDRYVFGEVQAGQSGSVEQLRETALGIPGFEWNAIEQQLVVGNAQQEARVAGSGQTLLQFIPRDFELGLGALVIVAIHPRILDEDVQTMNKRPCRGGPSTLRHVCGGDKELLVNTSSKLKGNGKR